jgi:hypothetical protein
MSLIENHDKPVLTTPDERQGFLDLGSASAAPILEPWFAPSVETIVEAAVEPLVDPIGEPVVEASVEPVVEPLGVASVEPVVEPPAESGAKVPVEPLQESRSMRSHDTADAPHAESQADLIGLPQKFAAVAPAGVDEAPHQATHEAADEAPPVAAVVPAARSPKRRSRIAEPALMAEPDLAHALADVAEALERRTPPEKPPEPFKAARTDLPAGLSQVPLEPHGSVFAPNRAATADDVHAQQVDQSPAAIPPAFAESAMPITLQHRTVKLAAGLFAATAGFGFITMVCAIWALYILTHPPLEVPAASPVVAGTAADQALASSVAALAPSASIPGAATPAVAAASAPAPTSAALHHHHRHKAKTGAAA